MLDEMIHRRWGTEERVHDRGWVLQRVFAHDVYHCGELNEILEAAGLPQIDLGLRLRLRRGDDLPSRAQIARVSPSSSTMTSSSPNPASSSDRPIGSA